MNTEIKIKDYYEGLSKEEKLLFRGLITRAFSGYVKHATFFNWLGRNRVPLHAIPKVREIIENPDFGLPQL